MVKQEYLLEWGLSQEFLAFSGYNDLKKLHTDIFFDRPHLAIGFGTIYYTILIALEFLFFSTRFSSETIIKISK